MFGQKLFPIRTCFSCIPWFKTVVAEFKIRRYDSDCELTHQNPQFQPFVQGLLKQCKLSAFQLQHFMQPKQMQLLSQAFTSASVSELHNYEFLELLGDSNLNCAIVEYLRRRFPHLNNPQGVKTIARLKIDWVSKDKFSYYANKLGFEHFVRCSNEQRLNGKVKRSVLEDVFEAFCGALVTVCDSQKQFSGYQHCFYFIESLMEREAISLRNEDLFDAKTRLKELFDVLKTHSIEYEHSVLKTTSNGTTPPISNAMILTKIWITCLQTGKRSLSATAQARTKKVSSQLAAKLSIQDLKNRGIYVETVNS